MRIFLLFVFMLFPMFLFSQVEFVKCDIDSLVVENIRLKVIKLNNEEKSGFYLLCRGRKEVPDYYGDLYIFLIKSQNLNCNPKDLYRRFIGDTPKALRKFKLRGIVKIDGVDVFVEREVPKWLFKADKKVSVMINRENQDGDLHEEFTMVAKIRLQ